MCSWDAKSLENTCPVKTNDVLQRAVSCGRRKTPNFPQLHAHIYPLLCIYLQCYLCTKKKKGVKICENTQNSLYICLKDLRMKSLGKLHTEIGNSRTYYSTKKKKENMKSYLYIFKYYIFLNWILWFKENLKATFNSREYHTSVHYQFPRSIV